MFSWIRLKVKNAVLAGFADAMDYLAAQASNVPENAQEILEEQTILALPGSTSEMERSKGKGKKVS